MLKVNWESHSSSGAVDAAIGKVLLELSLVPWVPALGRRRLEDQEHKIVFGHIASWRPAWTIFSRLHP